MSVCCCLYGITLVPMPVFMMLEMCGDSSSWCLCTVSTVTLGEGSPLTSKFGMNICEKWRVSTSVVWLMPTSEMSRVPTATTYITLYLKRYNYLKYSFSKNWNYVSLMSWHAIYLKYIWIRVCTHMYYCGNMSFYPDYGIKWHDFCNEILDFGSFYTHQEKIWNRKCCFSFSCWTSYLISRGFVSVPRVGVIKLTYCLHCTGGKAPAQLTAGSYHSAILTDDGQVSLD